MTAHKLWCTHARLAGNLAVAAIGCPPGAEVAVYVVARTRTDVIRTLNAVDGLHVAYSAVEVHPVGGGPEVAQAIARDDPTAMAVGVVLAVYGTTVIAVDDDGAVRTAGRYDHDRRRFVPATAADRLAEVIEVAEAVLLRGRTLGAGGRAAVCEVLAAAMLRQVDMRAAERAEQARRGGPVPACLADADDAVTGPAGPTTLR